MSRHILDKIRCGRRLPADPCPVKAKAIALTNGTRCVRFVYFLLDLELGGDFRSAAFVGIRSVDSSASSLSASDSVVSPSARRSSICPSVQVNSCGLETECAGVASTFFSSVGFRRSSFIISLIPILFATDATRPAKPLSPRRLRALPYDKDRHAGALLRALAYPTT